jgi:hypothetical protein
LKTGKIGTVSHGTIRTEDLIPALLAELEWLDEDSEWTDLIQRADKIENFDSNEAEDTLEELFDAIQQYCPPYCFFGGHIGDSSDFGYWVLESISEDFEGLKAADLSEVPNTYSGEVLLVNDHGNLTLYSCDKGECKEIWGIV